MKRVVIEKEVGETPLAALSRFQAAHLSVAHLPASYAGRLDPMASGKLLVLFGDECKRQRAYTGLDKEYEIEVLLDVGSDTGDVLGLTSYEHRETKPNAEVIRASLQSELGAHMRPYPIFSSKTIKGKSLFQHFYEGTLSEIEIPTHVENIYRIAERSSSDISQKEFERRIHELLTKVPRTNEASKRLGEDFRVDAVKSSWQKVFEGAGERNFRVLKLRVTCASGTYMRSLAGRIGESLGTKALALSIHRTKIGKYVPLGSRFGFWASSY